MIKPKHLILALVAGLWTSAALAGPFEDGAEAFKRGDYARALTAWGPIADTNPEVQNSLGVMYMHGEGIRPDYQRAYMWVTLSAAQGMPKAAINRDILQKQMSPQDIDIAMKMAARCKHSNYHACN